MDNTFRFAAAVGAGMTAIAAEKGGAEFLLLLNAGRLRMRGAPSLSCYLPVENCNQWVKRIGQQEVLNKCNLPILMGCSVSDPSLDIAELVDDALRSGFDGVTNFPSTCLLDGRMRELLEQEGMGFSRECELVREASSRGLKTLAYVTKAEETRMMLEAGASMLCVNIGFTHQSKIEPSALTIENTALIIDKALRDVPESIPTFVEGGPITTPESAMAICGRSKVQGYIAGSTIDRLPLEETIVDVVKSYKVISEINAKPAVADTDSNFIYGSSPRMKKIRSTIEAISELDEPVLIEGASGTGKNALIDEISRLSKHLKKKTLLIDCLSLSRDFGAEELFGCELGYHGRGTPSQKGLLEDSNDAIVIFDEISALSLDLQAKIVKFIDTGTVRRLGGDRHRKVNCRVISTTNSDIEDKISNGDFRRDLFFRLSSFHIKLPDLKDRKPDISILAKNQLKATHSNSPLKISNSALDILISYNWPGNIRELKNAIKRAALLCEAQSLTAKDFDFLRLRADNEDRTSDTTASPASPQETPPAKTEKEWIAEALYRNRFKRGPTAQELGITTRTLYSKIKKYNLHLGL